jgi:hypothetical protein
MFPGRIKAAPSLMPKGTLPRFAPSCCHPRFKIAKLRSPDHLYLAEEALI